MILRPLLWFAALLLVACSRREAASPLPDDPAPLLVRVAAVTSESLPIRLEVPATVRPAERASLAARLSGTVVSFPFGLGQAAAAGDVLVTLSAPEAEARVRQAQAQLAEAQRNADRAATLVSKGVNPPDSLRDAEDRLRYAQAAEAEAAAFLANATIRAPFAGVVTEKFVLPGDLASPGVPLLVLESTQHLRAEGTVPESAATILHPGASLGVILQEGAPPVTATIEEISAAANAVSRSVLVKAALPAGAARSGQFVRLQLSVGQTEALLVPAATVTRFGQMERIFVVDQGRAVLRLVKTGRTIGDRIEILSGVNAGEKIIIAPPAALREGRRVVESQP